MKEKTDNIKEKPQQLSVKEMFSQNDTKYVIPEYQRNYAWEEKELSDFLMDIVDWFEKDNKKAYYIGTLIVFNRKADYKDKTVYETIDGQQRLTTLNILLCVIKNIQKEKNIEIKIQGMEQYLVNLEFSVREDSTDTLNELFHYGKIINTKNFNQAIVDAYKIIIKKIMIIMKNMNDRQSYFLEYLFNKVVMFRVSVPEGTNLNHYFEIMNSRGVQLELHEILKSRCLETLSKKERYVFNLIWEACSGMEKYIQYEFSSDIRDKIFGNDLNILQFHDFESVFEILSLNKNTESPSKNADGKENSNILDGFEFKTNEDLNVDPDKEKDNASSERFHAVSSFPNFLLHTLRCITKEDIILDDKQLLTQFDKYISGEREIFVKKFAYNLLKARFLTDKFVIKREFLKGSESWSLKSIKKYPDSISYVNTFGNEEDDDNESENKDIIMLLSMFHVSNPSQNYKHWFTAVLNYLFENEKTITQNKFKIFLENLAKAFLFDNFLTGEKDNKNYYNIIFKNNCVPKNTVSNLNLQLLNIGTVVENFIFNYTDYLIWKNKLLTDINFEFTFRSSVEHFYPQQPVGNNEPLEDQYLNNFGNLCLISSSMNSRFSNNMPKAKIENFEKLVNNSLKLKLMMEIAKKKNWHINEIKEHSEEMKKLLLVG